jgi:hypothetical protein
MLCSMACEEAYIGNLSEQNHENIRAIEGDCVHWHVKIPYIDKHFWGKSPESSALEGGRVHWNVKKSYIDNYFSGKSREYQGLRGRLCSLAHEEILYWQLFLRKITRIQCFRGRPCSLAREEILYWQFFLRKITRIQCLRGRPCSLTYKVCIDNIFWGKSREYQDLGGEAVFTGMWRKLILAILSEANHENIRALEGGRVHWRLKKAYIGNSFSGKSWETRASEGGCVHWHVKKSYIDNYFSGKSREYQGLRRRLCSLTYEDTLYWQAFLRKITRKLIITEVALYAGGVH